MNETDTLKAQAFRLFEQGKYPACLDLIQTLPSHLMEIQLRILEAVCFYSTGSLEEAEVCLRDLKPRVPDSAEVCLYLGKVLEKKGDDQARAEFAEAVRLAPEHPEGIRRYARYLTRSNDNRAALNLLTRLVRLTGDPSDLVELMQCCCALGRVEEGLSWYLQAGSPAGCFATFLDLLMASGRYREIVEAIEADTGVSDESLTLLYLDALVQIDPDQADQKFLYLLNKNGSIDLASRYVIFLSGRGLIREALGVWSTWLEKSLNPMHRIQGAPLLESLSGPSRALELYQEIFFTSNRNDLSELSGGLSSYRSLLVRIYGPEGALDQVINLIKPDLYPELLIGVARWCEEAGRLDEARRLYLQGFRSDLTTIGLAYAAFLGRTGENREQVKILGYILKTVRKIRDLEIVAREVLNSSLSDLDLRTSLQSRFSEKIPLLSLDGREIYARLLCRSAESALESGMPDKALEFSLTGLSVVPVDSVQVAESLFALLIKSKYQVLPDYIPMMIRYSPKGPASVVSSEQISLSWLDPIEEAVVGYLRKHRVCHEMDLRKVAGTRRVAGLMNRIMRKAEEQGIHLAEKDGYSEFGEVYRYAGP